MRGSQSHAVLRPAGVGTGMQDHKGGAAQPLCKDGGVEEAGGPHAIGEEHGADKAGDEEEQVVEIRQAADLEEALAARRDDAYYYRDDDAQSTGSMAARSVMSASHFLHKGMSSASVAAPPRESFPGGSPGRLSDRRESLPMGDTQDRAAISMDVQRVSSDGS